MQTRDEKSKTLLFRVLIKRENLTCREVLYTKLVGVISLKFVLQKICVLKYVFFSLKNCQLKRKKNWHSMFLKIFKFQPTRKWVNKVNLSSFSTQNLFQIRACVISSRKAKHLDVTTMITCSHANTPLGQSERAYYL